MDRKNKALAIIGKLLINFDDVYLRKLLNDDITKGLVAMAMATNIIRSE